MQVLRREQNNCTGFVAYRLTMLLEARIGNWPTQRKMPVYGKVAKVKMEITTLLLHVVKNTSVFTNQAGKRLRRKEHFCMNTR